MYQEVSPQRDACQKSAALCIGAEKSLLYSKIYHPYRQPLQASYENEFEPKTCCFVMYTMLHTKTKGIVPQKSDPFRPQTQSKFLANSIHDSAIVNILAITVLGDSVPKNVSIILLRVKRLALRIFPSLEEKRHTETKPKV